MTDWAVNLQRRNSSRKSPESSNRNSTAKEKTSAAQIVSDPYNASEVLSFLSARFNEELSQAKADKSGEKFKIYQSLESSSGWTTKTSSSSKRSSIGDDYDLLKELNRGLQRRSNTKS